MNNKSSLSTLSVLLLSHKPVPANASVSLDQNEAGTEQSRGREREREREREGVLCFYEREQLI